MTRTRIVRSLGDVGLDAQDWNALAAQSDTNSVFQTYEWIRSWSTVFGDQYAPLFVAVGDGRDVWGVAPLVLDRTSPGECIVRFAGDGRADYCDFVTGADKARAMEAIFDALAGVDGWDVIELNNVPAHSRTTEMVRGLGARAGWLVLTDDHFLCPTLLVAGHGDALKIFNKPSMRRRENYFARSGRLVGRDLTTAGDIEAYLDAFFAQHIARWSGTSSPSLFLNGRNQAFYRELTRNASVTGWLLFSVIEVDDRPIAFHFGFDYNDVIMWYKPSFDPARANHSPGMVLLRHLIGYAIERNRRELDFTVGDEPFKRRFTNSIRRTVRIQIFKDRARYMREWTRSKLVGVVRKYSR